MRPLEILIADKDTGMKIKTNLENVCIKYYIVSLKPCHSTTVTLNLDAVLPYLLLGWQTLPCYFNLSLPRVINFRFPLQPH